MKKQIIAISFLFAEILMFGSSISLNAQPKIIGKPTPISIQYSLQIAQFGFPNQMNCADAKKACEGLGEGWRSPTKNELNSMFINKNIIGGFSSNSYWSYSELSIFAWNQYFNYGGKISDLKANLNYARAVGPL